MLHIESRDYSLYKYVDESNQCLDLSFSCPLSASAQLGTKGALMLPCPIKNKMFHGDTINNKCSQYRTVNIPGILILNKTYGSIKPGKLLYRFIPDKNFLPIFLVPYELKSTFLKAHKNKFAIIKFKEWTQEHPVGVLQETIGDVDTLEAFCEYQLHRRGLYVSMSAFNAHVKMVLKNEQECIATIQQRYQLPLIGEGENIFSIDPATSLDYDDAFSVKHTGINTYRITVYIANVYLWLETFDLFKFMTDRVSTIYLPDKKRPMLPLLLSDNYCSLKAGAKRVVYTYSQEFNIETRQPIKEPVFEQGIAFIAKNWAYEDLKLETADGYAVLKQLSGKTDSHDVVAHWMIQMNVACAERGVTVYRGTDPMWNTTEVLFNNKEGAVGGNVVPLTAKYSLEPLEHRALDVQKYTHITSPIRRLVDIMNQGPLPNWLNRIDYINDQCKQIKRAQMDCDLLAFSMNAEPDAEYEGTIIKIDERTDMYEYTVQLSNALRVRFKEPVGISSPYGRAENSREIQVPLEIGSKHMFKIFAFNDEHTLYKKVQLIRI
jgi:hypothetical protein